MAHPLIRAIVDAQLERFHGRAADPAEAVSARALAAREGVLQASETDLAMRARYLDLDRGVYCANHSMGKPSTGWLDHQRGVLEHLPVHGIGAWETGGWMEIGDRFRAVVAELVGQDLVQGDVGHFTGFSDGLSALLFGLTEPGPLVTTGGHFITGHYVHRVWAEQVGVPLTEVSLDEDGSCPAERVVDALRPDTAVVSVAQGFWRTGWVHDVDAIAAGVRRICPDAVLVVDVYQTLGTVPCRFEGLPERSAILGGGIKQLRAGAGAGFGWFSRPLLAALRPTRAGWFGHRDPMAFAPEFTPGEGAAMFRTGAPDVLPMASLIHELEVLAGWTGDLRSALDRAHLRTSAQVQRAVALALELDLDVVGPRWPGSRRAAFFGIRLADGSLVERLAEEGVAVDFRPDAPGEAAGVLRISATAMGFDYELEHTLRRIAALKRAQPS